MKKTLVFMGAMFLTSLAFAATVWIDVRTAEEYAQDHINGDPRISYEEIVPGVQKMYPDKNTDIRLYCRSGHRAGVALTKLKEAGYTHVTNVGSIGDARKERGLSR